MGHTHSTTPGCGGSGAARPVGQSSSFIGTYTHTRLTRTHNRPLGVQNPGQVAPLPFQGGVLPSGCTGGSAGLAFWSSGRSWSR